MTIPISSQWPSVVSLPFERSISRPATAGAPACGRAALELLDVPEAERLEIGQVEAADRPRDVPERVRALVAELGRIRQRPAPTASSTITHARGSGLPVRLVDSGTRAPASADAAELGLIAGRCGDAFVV